MQSLVRDTDLSRIADNELERKLALVTHAYQSSRPTIGLDGLLIFERHHFSQLISIFLNGHSKFSPQKNLAFKLEQQITALEEQNLHITLIFDLNNLFS